MRETPRVELEIQVPTEGEEILVSADDLGYVLAIEGSLLEHLGSVPVAHKTEKSVTAQSRTRGR